MIDDMLHLSDLCPDLTLQQRDGKRTKFVVDNIQGITVYCHSVKTGREKLIPCFALHNYNLVANNKTVKKGVER